MFPRHAALGPHPLQAEHRDAPRRCRRSRAAFRELVGRPDAPVLIDQEGGRVQRAAPPRTGRTIPPRRPMAAARTLAEGGEAASLAGRLIADDLMRLGITVDWRACARPARTRQS